MMPTAGQNGALLDRNTGRVIPKTARGDRNNERWGEKRGNKEKGKCSNEGNASDAASQLPTWSRGCASLPAVEQRVSVAQVGTGTATAAAERAAADAVRDPVSGARARAGGLEDYEYTQTRKRKATSHIRIPAPKQKKKEKRNTVGVSCALGLQKGTSVVGAAPTLAVLFVCLFVFSVGAGGKVRQRNNGLSDAEREITTTNDRQTQAAQRRHRRSHGESARHAVRSPRKLRFPGAFSLMLAFLG